MAEGSLEDLQKTVKDGLYVAVGLGVIAFQRAQVQRQELRKQAESNLEATRGTVGDHLKTAGERLDALDDRLDPVFEGVEAQLPAPARALLHQSRGIAQGARRQFFQLAESATSR